MTLAELAEQADVNRKTVLRIELNPDYSTSVDIAGRIAKALGETMDTLFGHNSERTTHGVPRGKHHGPPDDVLADNEGPDMHIGE